MIFEVVYWSFQIIFNKKKKLKKKNKMKKNVILLPNYNSHFCYNFSCNACTFALNMGANKKKVGIALINKYTEKGPTILLGQEKSGEYVNQFNICTGTLNLNESCFIKCAIGVLSENFKQRFTPETFLSHITNFSENFKLVVYEGTLVFFGEFYGISRKKTNDLISLNKSNKLYRVDFFKLYDIHQLEPAIDDNPQYCQVFDHKSKEKVSALTKNIVDIISNNKVLYDYKKNGCNNFNCNACKFAISLGANTKGGVGTAVVNKYTGVGSTILLGKENGGRYVGQYNICSGKMDSGEKCFVTSTQITGNFAVSRFAKSIADSIVKNNF